MRYKEPQKCQHGASSHAKTINYSPLDLNTKTMHGRETVGVGSAFSPSMGSARACKVVEHKIPCYDKNWAEDDWEWILGHSDFQFAIPNRERLPFSPLTIVQWHFTPWPFGLKSGSVLDLQGMSSKDVKWEASLIKLDEKFLRRIYSLLVVMGCLGRRVLHKFKTRWNCCVRVCLYGPIVR